MLEDFDDSALGRKIIESIHKEAKGVRKLRIMEVCGTHTRSIHKSGIASILPSNIKLVSGPGCPVCVTPKEYIDIALSIESKDIIIATFSDVLRVKGRYMSLLDARSLGYNIKVITSPLEALDIAANTNLNVVLIGVGFETTSSTIAVTLIEAKKRGINNLYLLSFLKTMPNALKALIEDKENKIDGYICPGHVGSIIGNNVFDKLAREKEVSMAMSGFNSIDILSSILTLINMIKEEKRACSNLYTRAVKDFGNKKALDAIKEVFEECSSLWRGMSSIDFSGYKLKNTYKDYDAQVKFKLTNNLVKEDDCTCRYIITGKMSPEGCRYFGRECTIDNPKGPCMISSEGACYIKYLCI